MSTCCEMGKGKTEQWASICEKQISKSESFDAGNPVGGIEPVNISYYIINFFKEKRANICPF